MTAETNSASSPEPFAAHEPARRWGPWLRRVRLGRPHELTPDLERMILDRSPAAPNQA